MNGPYSEEDTEAQAASAAWGNPPPNSGTQTSACLGHTVVSPPPNPCLSRKERKGTQVP